MEKSGSTKKSESLSAESIPGPGIIKAGQKVCAPTKASYECIKQKNSNSKETDHKKCKLMPLLPKAVKNPNKNSNNSNTNQTPFPSSTQTTSAAHLTANKVFNHCDPIPTHINVQTYPAAGSLPSSELPPTLSPQCGKPNHDVSRALHPPTLSPIRNESWRQDCRKSKSPSSDRHRRGVRQSRTRSPERYRRKSRTRSPYRYLKRLKSRRSRPTNRFRRSCSISPKRRFHSRPLSRSISPLHYRSLSTSRRHRRRSRSKSTQRYQKGRRDRSKSSDRSRRFRRSKTPHEKESLPSVRRSKSIGKDQKRAKSVGKSESYTPKVTRPQRQVEVAESYTAKLAKTDIKERPVVKSEPSSENSNKEPLNSANEDQTVTSLDQSKLIINNFLRKLLEDERTRAAASMLIENVSESQDDELRTLAQAFKSESDEELISKRRRLKQRPIIETDEDSEGEKITKPARCRISKTELDQLHEDLNIMFKNEDLWNMTTRNGRKRGRLFETEISKNFDCNDPKNFILLKYMMSAKVYVTRNFSTAETIHYKGKYALRELNKHDTRSYRDSQDEGNRRRNLKFFEKEKERYTLRPAKPLYLYTEFSSDEDTEKNSKEKTRRDVTPRGLKVKDMKSQEEDEAITHPQPGQENKQVTSSPNSKRITRWDIGPQKQNVEEVEPLKEGSDSQPSQENKKVEPVPSRRKTTSSVVGEKLNVKETKPSLETPPSEKNRETILQKRRTSPRKKRRKGWADGVIPKLKRRKMVTTTTEQAVTTVSMRKQPPVIVETNKQLRCVQSHQTYSHRSFSCDVCNLLVRNLHFHYRLKHPNHVIPLSRLTPDRAEEAIQESVTLKLDEWKDFSCRLWFYHFKCRFCDMKFYRRNSEFYSHVTIHTGEYQVNCHLCPWGEMKRKHLQNHYKKHHNCEAPKSSGYPPIVERVTGYICTECYYVQMNRKNIEDHVKNHHLGDSKMMRIYLASLNDQDMQRWHFLTDKEVEIQKPCPLSVKKNLDEEQRFEGPSKPTPKIETVVKKKYKACPLSVKQKLEELEKRQNENLLAKKIKPIEEEKENVEAAAEASNQISEKNLHIPSVIERISPTTSAETDRKDYCLKKSNEHSVQIVEQLKSRLLEDQNFKPIKAYDIKERGQLSGVVLSAGFLDVVMSGTVIEYVCRLPSCHFHSKHHAIFLDHWTTDHGIVATYKMTTCLICKNTISVSKNQKLLNKFFNHVESAHLGINRIAEEESGENSNGLKKDDVLINIDDNDEESQKTLKTNEDLVLPIDLDSDDESKEAVDTEKLSSPPNKVQNEETFNGVPPNVDSEGMDNPLPYSGEPLPNVNVVVNAGILDVIDTPDGLMYRCHVSDCQEQSRVLEKFLDHWKNSHTEIHATVCMACDGKVIIFECLGEFFDHVEKKHLKPNPFSFQISEVVSLADSAALKPAEVSSLAEDPSKFLIHTNDLLKTANFLYKCPFTECYFSTNETYLFANHIQVHNKALDTIVCCVYCKMKTEISKYINHVDNYHGNCRYSCTLCPYRSLMKEYVIYHMKTQHEGPIKLILLKPPTNHNKVINKRLTVSQACPPYRCGYEDCASEYLYQNEYMFHLDYFHGGLGLCGFGDLERKCDFRNFSKNLMMGHWSTHNLYNFHCLICARGTINLDKMLKHYTLSHFHLEPLVVDRRMAPSGVQFGYTADACSKITFVQEEMLNIVANEPYTIENCDPLPAGTLEIDGSDEDQTPENVIEPKRLEKVEEPKLLEQVEGLPDEETLSEDFLVKRYGKMCLPSDNAFRCPLCLEFTTKKISYFVYHLLVELKCDRYRCSTCSYSCIPLDTMLAHWQDDHNNLVTANLTELPLDQKVEFWIELVLKFQAKVIVDNASLSLGYPNQSTFYSTRCDFCQRWFRNIDMLNDHEICHWADLTFTCNKCSARRATLDEVFEHIRRKHPESEYSISANAPSLVIPTWKRFPPKKAVARPEPTAIQNSEIMYGCLQCSKTVYTVEEVKKHQVEEHGGNADDFRCRIMKKVEMDEFMMCILPPKV